MTQPIYRLWQARPTEAWYQLPEEEQQRLLGKLQEALEAVGGKEVVVCDSAWCNERWTFFGVEEFPDLDALQRLDQIHIDLNWWRYVDSYSTLGTQSATLG